MPGAVLPFVANAAGLDRRRPARRRDGEEVRVFLLGRRRHMALAEVGLGGSGMDTRAIRENQPVDGSRRSALEELADWTVSPAAVHLNEHQNVPVSAKHCELLCLDL